LVSAYYIRSQRKIIDTLRAEEIKLFREGNSQLINDYENANKQAQHLPFDGSFEIDLSNNKLNIGMKILLSYK